MFASKTLTFGRPATSTSPTRRAAAALLHGASLALSALARRLVAVQARRAEPLLEFHAEAGAPEGALYVDGQLVGYVTGVRRL